MQKAWSHPIQSDCEVFSPTDLSKDPKQETTVLQSKGDLYLAGFVQRCK